MTDLWFGNTSKMMLVPAPDLPFSANEIGYSESMAFENGGQAATGSAADAKQYDFSFDFAESVDLAKYKRFRRGSFGSGLLYFPHPFGYTRNLFSSAWAEPGLIEQGWPSIYDTAPTYAAVSSNAYDQPQRKAVFTISQAANTAPSLERSVFIVPIPPGYTLHVGVSGAATGTAVVRVQPVTIGAALPAATNLTLLTDTASTRLNASFASASYDYVSIDFRRTSGAASTLTLTSMMAQLWPTGVTPTLTGLFIPGEGQTGMRFLGDTFTTSGKLWRESDGTTEFFSGMAFSMVEVGAWLTE